MRWTTRDTFTLHAELGEKWKVYYREGGEVKGVISDRFLIQSNDDGDIRVEFGVNLEHKVVAACALPAETDGAVEFIKVQARF